MSDGRTSEREALLGLALVAVAALPLASVVWPLLRPDRYPEIDLAFHCARTTTFWAAVMVAGACLRPLPLRVLVVGLALVWWGLDLLALSGLFNVYASFERTQPFVYFQF